MKLIQECYGLGLRRVSCPINQKPYPDWIDRNYKFPLGYKIPEFSIFSRDYYQFTIEHIGRFTVQCGEASTNVFLKLRLFANSFTWYINLPPNSVYSWQEMEL
ncbi:hypothetical protein CFOL_v3_01331 [Cephalotus follicularis]|uniref:Uncharacterized protein n=1 Tax=Cephalotus follicularis TaxID=3775 RepID=A0A1Q3AQ69_CEPFO|nr:hypothetical protein CFOL_v3_01331 [Cephalotus follicularis]